MAYIEIKHEFESEHIQCRTCLSVCRKMYPIGKYIHIYRRLIVDYDQTPEDSMVCWECYALLCKVMQFQWQVERAHELLRLGQSFMYGTLSTLTTFIINDTHPDIVYVNSEINKQTEHSTICTETTVKTEPESDSGEDNLITDENITGNVVSKPEVVVLPEKKNKTINNKWAQKRALQNKRPKFKIVTLDCVNDGSYKTIPIQLKEFHEFVVREKNTEKYKSARYRCEYCLLDFKKRSLLVKHNDKCHKPDQDFICDLCNKGLLNKRRLAAHIRKHLNKYICTYCDYCTTHRKLITQHIQRDHIRVFECLKCHLRFGSRRDFFRHFKEWHEKFICDTCGVSFKMRYCIKDHIRKQHGPFECTECGKHFARYNGLWLHARVRHGTPGTPAYCVECDRRYADVYRYRWHLANSTRHAPRQKLRIPCPGCDKVFSKNIYMKDHYNLVHLKYYKYRCEPCDKNFIRNADLVKHKRRVHEGILPPRNKECKICGRAFTTNKILRNHMRTHTGERPFACSPCGARFAQAAALRAHHRALHGRWPRDAD